MRFDGENQQIEGKASIKALKTKKGSFGNVVDLTSLYSKKVEKVERSIFLNIDKSMFIHDEWTTKEKAVEVTWQWLTKAKVRKTASSLVLKQDGKQLAIKVEQPLSGISIEIEDVSAPKNLQDSPNPNLTRILIKQKTAAQSNGKLFVRVQSITLPDKKLRLIKKG